MGDNHEIMEAPSKKDRVKGEMYLLKGEKRIWNGKRWHCVHNRRKDRCKDCGGSSICIHDKIRNRCKDCGGSQICIHGKRKSACKDCGGGSICVHNKIRSTCKDCGGSQICVHDRVRSTCKDCGGGSICIHGKRKSACKDCGGGLICIHDKIRSYCKDCGGSQICVHDRVRSTCKDCGGGSICIHDRERRHCKICDPDGYLASLMRSRVRTALKNYSNSKKKERTMGYVGCNLKTLRQHLEKQFTDGMNWENQGKWHIDHRKPCASFDLSKEEERKKCFHYTNLQPLWGSENMSKSDSHNPNKFKYKWDDKIGWCELI